MITMKKNIFKMMMTWKVSIKILILQVKHPISKKQEIWIFWKKLLLRINLNHRNRNMSKSPKHQHNPIIRLKHIYPWIVLRQKMRFKVDLRSSNKYLTMKISKLKTKKVQPKVNMIRKIQSQTCYWKI